MRIRPRLCVRRADERRGSDAAADRRAARSGGLAQSSCPPLLPRPAEGRLYPPVTPPGSHVSSGAKVIIALRLDAHRCLGGPMNGPEAMSAFRPVYARWESPPEPCATAFFLRSASSAI